MSVTVYSGRGQKLPLTTEIGRGGEGIVYSLSTDECAKIYSKPLSPENRRKLELMVQNPPSDPSYDTRKHRSISWPTGLLYNDIGRLQCVGFSMPKIDVKVFRKAIYYLDPSDRTKQLGGAFNWKYLYTAAFNIVSSVAAIHERKYCIGDLNESNVLIAPIALITLIDCDSFQVPDPTTGKVYRCPVGKAEYTAPELQGKSYCDVDRTAETDCFALAVLLFQLLMEGTHPYQAKGKLVEDAPSTQAKIVKGYFPYTMRPQGIAPPNHAPSFEILHPDIRQLFHRCFANGHLNPQARPTARDWFNTLRMLGNRFRQCQANENHVFLDHLNSCPWCEILKTMAKDPFPSPIGRQIALDEPSVTLDSLQKRVDYLGSYVAMAFADGVLTAEEESYLFALGSKLQIPRKEIEKAIQAEAKKTNAQIASSAGSRPQLEISRTHFEFHDMRVGTSAQGSLNLSNTGGGTLQGSIRSNRSWLRPSQSQIDTTRHRQEIGFQVDTTGLSKGVKERGNIEVRSNGGTQVIAVDVSVKKTPMTSAVLAVALLAGLVILCSLCGLVQRSYQQHLTQTQLEIGVMATCSEERGCGNYVRKTTFRPGEVVCVYFEAPNLGRSTQMELTLNTQILGSGGVVVASHLGRLIWSGGVPGLCAYDCNTQLPLNAPAGNYVAQVDVRNNSTGQTGHASTTIAVVASGRANLAKPSPSVAERASGQSEAELQRQALEQITGRWNGRWGPDNNREVLVLSHASGAEFTGTSFFETRDGVVSGRGIVTGLMSRGRVEFTLSRDGQTLHWVGDVDGNYRTLTGMFAKYANNATYTKQ